MAICFARVRYVGRSTNGNACNSSAYNARSKIVDEKTGEVFNYEKRSGSVYHKMLLPEHVNKKFKDISVFANEVERSEKRKDSQLFEEWVLALPKEEEITLEMKKELVLDYVKSKDWVQEGLGVQIDIHAPHEGEDNWHIHILRTTRRFRKDGLGLEPKKAIDLKPEIKYGKVQKTEELEHHAYWRNFQNEKYKGWGLKLRVDLPGKITQEHIGPVRMRSVMNEAVYRNEETKEANIKYLNSGARLLENVTHHMSVFNKADLERAVKIIPDALTRDKLVEGAIASNSLISLHDENGKSTGYFSTKEIRGEEKKLLRLSSYIATNKNCISLFGANALSTANGLINDVGASLTKERQEQHAALSHLLFGDSGIRILRGRAGTGKSHVLGHVQRIATAVGVNVIGLAPTHKARGELANNGYEQNDTIKGMLFKLNNGRFDLPKGSLLVVDEAGMVGNDDFKELLRVAVSRKCNVILAGDEKQLASVQRGGMFEVFSDRYGSSTILNIQRQKDAWGRNVAMAFSNGEVKSGVAILQEKNRIIECFTKDDSMQRLLSDWSKSKEFLTDRLIIAVTNRDVNALNHGARQYLKLSGDLRGEEISVAGNHYMKGDRILIKDCNKGLGLVNGDFVTVVHASKERFVISMEGIGANKTDVTNDNKKLVEFNPSAYSGFKHGYATTVFKAQGASILDVFVFHDGFAGIRNSYVALTRNVKNLRLYINNQATKSIGHLVKQLGHDPEIGSSLSYLTQEDLASRAVASGAEKEQGVFSSMFSSAVDFTKDKIIAFNDKYFIDNAYYKYEAPKLTRARVEDVLDIVAGEMEVEAIGSKIALEERAVVGGNSNHITASSRNSSLPKINKVKQTTKERFYAKADYARNSTRSLDRQAQWDMEAERLRSEVKYKTEAIARALLGEPNKNLSNGKTLRFGDHGKIAVRISGERMGSWFDFSSDKGGDMFALVQDRQGCDFKGAAEYLRQSVGIETGGNNHIKLVHDHRNKDLTEKYIKAKVEEERVANAKAEQVEKLYSRAKNIGNRSVAYKYLTGARGLNLFSSNHSNILSNDIKTTGVYVASEKGSSEKGKYLPVLVAFARDSEGNVTGGQQIYLDKAKAIKADIAIPKKSFGKIAGSFVDVGNLANIGDVNKVDKNIANDKLGKITIIAEGLETAMSVRQGLSEHNKLILVINQGIKVICSLGISNIRNYQPDLGEKIIIAADNDGVGSNTSKTIENAKIALEEKGAFVEIVQPSTEGDFNDVLKSDGSKTISDAFESALTKHTARTLEEYFSKDTFGTKLDENDKSNLAYLKKYDFPQSVIVDAYRKNELSGKIELEFTRKSLEMAANQCSDNKATLDEAKQWGYKGSDADITKSLVGMNKNESYDHINDIRNSHLESYFASNFRNFSAKKYSLGFEKQKVLISKVQNFLRQTFEKATTSEDLIEYKGDNRYLLMSGRAISHNPEKLDELFEKCKNIKANDIRTERELCGDMAFSRDIDSLIKEAGTTIERHHLKTIPAELAIIREKAVSIDVAFAAIEKEQNKLANQHGKIKYLDFETELLAKCKIAHNQRLDNSLSDLKDIANRLLDVGANTEVELLKNLQQVTDLKKAYTKLDKDMEAHHITSTLDGLEQEKQAVKMPNEILNVIAKEQEFLSSLHNNIKYKYPEHHPDISEKSELAHNQREDNSLGALKDIVNQALDAGVKTKKELVVDLQQVTDLKVAYVLLDKDIEVQHINNTLHDLEQEKQAAKTPNEILNIISKEQEFLSGLHNSIKYSEHHADIPAKSELAYNQKEDNSFGGLKDIVNQALDVGVKTKEELVGDLQQVTDLKSGSKNIGIDIENYQIKETIATFKVAMNKANNPIEVLNVLTKKESYLSNIEDKLEYPEYISEEIANTIEVANDNKELNKLDDLNKLVTFVVDDKLYNNTDIVKHLKEPESLTRIMRNIIINYQDRYLQNVEQNLSRIEKQGEVLVNGRKFDSHVEYLDHTVGKCGNKYAPSQQLREIQQHAIATELESQKVDERAQEKAAKSMDFER